jgi:hypothetical protein
MEAESVTSLAAAHPVPATGARRGLLFVAPARVEDTSPMSRDRPAFACTEPAPELTQEGRSHAILHQNLSR